MTNEEKQLLIKDLCGMLPYEVKGLHRGEIQRLLIMDSFGSYQVNGYDAWFDLKTVPFKPYLRPISSMTDKEMDKLFDILHVDKDGNDEDWIRINGVMGIRFFFPAGKYVEDVIEVYDYLNSIHIDYRGLISKGLALEAPEGMYETE